MKPIRVYSMFLGGGFAYFIVFLELLTIHQCIVGKHVKTSRPFADVRCAAKKKPCMYTLLVIFHST